MCDSASASNGPSPNAHARKAKRSPRVRDGAADLESYDSIKRHKGAEIDHQEVHWGLPTSVASSALVSFQRAASSRMTKLDDAGCTPSEMFTSCLLSLRRTAPTKVSKFDWSFSRNSYPHLSQQTLGAAYIVRNELSNLLLEGYNLSDAVKILAFRLSQEIDPSELSIEEPLLELVSIDPPEYLIDHTRISSPNSSLIAQNSSILSNTPNFFNSSNSAIQIPHEDMVSSVQPKTPIIEDQSMRDTATLHSMSDPDEFSPSRPKRSSQDILQHRFDLQDSFMPDNKRSCVTER